MTVSEDGEIVPILQCVACGSYEIYYDPADGWTCKACHRTDADE